MFSHPKTTDSTSRSKAERVKNFCIFLRFTIGLASFLDIPYIVTDFEAEVKGEHIEFMIQGK